MDIAITLLSLVALVLGLGVLVTIAIKEAKGEFHGRN
jgi:hypothetical protein